MYKLGQGGNSIIREYGAFIPVQPGNRDYDEYKEWLEVDDDNVINDGVLYCNYLG